MIAVVDGRDGVCAASKWFRKKEEPSHSGAWRNDLVAHRLGRQAGGTIGGGHWPSRWLLTVPGPRCAPVPVG